MILPCFGEIGYIKNVLTDFYSLKKNAPDKTTISKNIWLKRSLKYEYLNVE